jgi:oligoendopeptidase F
MSDASSPPRWDIESIFPGGSSSPQFAEFRKQIAIDLDKAQKTVSDLPRELTGDSSTHWVAFLLMMQDTALRIQHADSFALCLHSQDVTDDKALDITEEMSSKEAQWRAIMTDVEEFALAVEDEAWRNFLNHPKLKPIAFYLNEMRDRAKVQMAPELEKLATKLAVNGYHAWNQLYQKLSGDLKVDFEEDGKTKMLSMGQLSNKMASPDRDVRKRAFDKLTETWKSVEGLAAMALNSQAGYRLTLYKARGWESPIFEPLMNCRLKHETIDAMWNAVANGRDKMSDYIGAKKKLLGTDQFRWYDQIAPIGKVEKNISYGEACDFVVKHFSSFSEDLGKFARRAIDNHWIEAEDRFGKAAGGFCTGFPVAKETRIFMTFSGNYDQMMTLAHELGHSYHSWILRNQDYFARRYPMNLAETASTFNELLVTDAALKAADSDEEKLSLLDKKIQEGFTMFCNIRARYIFDTMFYKERKNGTVSKERLGEMMIEAQKAAYGDILAEDGYHPLFWASKLHFFITEAPFYNFPYAFGYLFAGGIYDRAQKEGASFAQKYIDLLADTGSMTTEDVARKHLDVDLTSDQFWTDAVNRVLMDVDTYIQLSA